jgi:hypothetical protein
MAVHAQNYAACALTDAISVLDGYSQVGLRYVHKSRGEPVSVAANHHAHQVLQVGPLKPSLAETLRTSYRAYVLPENPAERGRFLDEHGDEITVVATSGRTGVDAALMSALLNLGAVVNFGVGYDTTDMAAAARNGVVVSNTPDVLTDCVADTAVGLMIDVLRQFSAADRYVRAGRWPADGNYPLTRQVSHTRVGIVGLGRIGTAIASRLTAFGCSIRYHNRRPVTDSPFAYVDSPVELARQVDVLIVAAAGGSGQESDRRGRARRARTRRVPDQHRPRQRGRRGRVGAGADRGPARRRGTRCVRRRAARARCAAVDGQRRAAPPCG